MTETTGHARALDGLRVIDFGHYLAGPLAALFLADNGADVIHVDPPDGPRWDHPANAALYRGKRTIALDLKSDTGRAEARRLIRSADVVIENFRPGVMDRLGLSPEAFIQGTESLIWCSMPGFPSDDLRSEIPAWEGIVCAATALYSPAGLVGEDPRFTALPLASSFAAFIASHRIAAALLARLRHGKGQRLEVSLYEAAFEALSEQAEVPASRELNREFLARSSVYRQPRPGSDGAYVYFDTPLRGLQALLERFGLGYDLRSLDDAAARRLAAELDELIRQKPAIEWERIGQEEVKGSVGLVQSTCAWLHDRHALDSGTVVQVDDPELGPTLQPGYPALLSRTPPFVRCARRPPVSCIDWLREKREDPTIAAGTLPLDGIRVLDCASLLAGPTTTRILAQYGAEVIKVDKAGVATGEIDLLSDDVGALVGTRTVNAGKRMVFLDLHHPVSRDVLASIVREMDVVHHNFTPEAAARLGLSADQVRALNPDAVYSTMSLHSHGGFRAEYRGHDMVAQMATGMGTRMGGDGPPLLQSFYINDHSAGHLNAFGIMLALLHRNRTGQAQEVNCALSRAATMLQVPFMLDFADNSPNEPVGPDARGWHALNRLYRAQDGWLYVVLGSSGGDEPARNGLPPILAGLDAVPGNRLADWLTARFSSLTVAECVTALVDAGFAAHRYTSLTDLLLDEENIRRQLITVVNHPGIGRAMGIGVPTLGSLDPVATRQLAARRPGLDTVDVLAEFGYEQALPRLIREGAIAIGEGPIVNCTTSPGFWARVPSASLPLVRQRIASIVEHIIDTPVRAV
jgi:crotonobetainyl-CoA:carnitine CoA-transferase CaiB-like acyl-CoA transferase